MTKTLVNILIGGLMLLAVLKIVRVVNRAATNKP